MKIDAELIGANNGINFQTMEQRHSLVLSIFGTVVEVPVSEEVFDTIVIKAAQQSGIDTEGLEDTRASLSVEEREEAAARRPVRELPEVNFSMGSLHETGVDTTDTEDEEEEPGTDQLSELFDDAAPEQTDPTVIAKLRARAQENAARAGGGPLPPAFATGVMPQIPGFSPSVSDDDGIPQG